MTEKELEAQAKDYLRLKGWAIMPKHAFPRGWPDLTCFRNERALLIELKAGKAKLGPLQEQRIAELLRCGVVVPVCYTLEEVMDAEARARGGHA